MDLATPTTVSPLDELQAMASAIKARRLQAQPTRREATGPFPLTYAQPERKPQPYLLVKAGARS